MTNESNNKINQTKNEESFLNNVQKARENMASSKSIARYKKRVVILEFTLLHSRMFSNALYFLQSGRRHQHGVYELLLHRRVRRSLQRLDRFGQSRSETVQYALESQLNLWLKLCVCSLFNVLNDLKVGLITDLLRLSAFDFFPECTLQCQYNEEANCLITGGEVAKCVIKVFTTQTHN